MQTQKNKLLVSFSIKSIQHDEASGNIFSNKLFARPDVFKKATFSYVFFIQRDILT